MELNEFIREQTEHISEQIGTSDVFVVGFVRYGQRLLIDTRSSGSEPPLIQLSQAVGQGNDRLEDLLRSRPGLGTPNKFSFIAWPRSIKNIQELGVWDRIRERVLSTGHNSTGHELDVVLGMLKQVEHLETNEAIGGSTRYRSLWPRGQGGSPDK